MKSPSAHSSKFRQALFFIVFIGLAVWGGWGLARMGNDRANMKAEAEAFRTAGVGTKTEVVEAMVTPAVVPVAEPASAPAAPAPAATPVPPPAPVAVAVVEAEPEPVVVGPPVVSLTTVPSAEVRLVVDGVSRPIGLADAAGVFRTDTLPVGPAVLTVAHRDYAEAVPVSLTLVAGETLTPVLRPDSLPASLTLFTDEGTVAHLDGRKVGEHTVMLGKVPSGRALALRLVDRDGKETTQSLTLTPRESRLLDLRTRPSVREEAPLGAGVLGDAVAGAPLVDPAAAPAGSATPAAPDAGAPAAPTRANDAVAVAPKVRVPARVVAVTPESGLVSVRGTSARPPMVVGGEAVLFAPGLEPVRLVTVRVFGAVSVCKAESIPAGLVAGPAELSVVK